MTKNTTSFTLIITYVVKHSKTGTKQPVLKFEAYPIDERLCTVTLLREYMKRTASVRGQYTIIFELC